MNILYEIRHGSKESIDEDVYVVCDKIPTKEEYSEFKKNTTKDCNFITIENGIVTNCFKGLTDEINNSIFYTFDNHTQTCINPIKTPMKRDVFPKVVMVVRELLAYASRTQYRGEIKRVLKSSKLSDRIGVLREIELNKISSFEKMPNFHAYKFYAQQIGLLEAMLCGWPEIFDKSEYGVEYKPFLYRENTTDEQLSKLSHKLTMLVDNISSFYMYRVLNENDNIITLKDGRHFDIKYERYIEE